VRPGGIARVRGTTPGERGFALVSVLWVVVGVSALAMVASLTAREAVQAARNRSSLLAAHWQAEDCVARARAAIAAVLADAGGEAGPGNLWDELDQRVADATLLAGCRVTLRAAGAGLDANRADEESLRRLLRFLEVPEAQADSLTDALLDWRDPDDEPRPRGIEAGGYRALRLRAPRNGPFADPREVLHVRGADRVGGIDTLLTVDTLPVPVNHAPLPVLAALPGLSSEAVAQIAALRVRGERMSGFAALQARISPAARQDLAARFPELARSTTMSPAAWTVTSRANSGTPAVTAVLEVRLVRAGDRAALVRRRSWIE
jgi:type II secretory pathway component PulK